MGEDMTRIPIDSKFIPLRWEENLVKNQKIGGVMLVFLEGKDTKEIDKKVKLTKQFCKQLKKSNRFTKVCCTFY